MSAPLPLLTSTLQTISGIFSEIPTNLKPAALYLLSTLATIDIALLIFKVDEVDWIKTLCRKALKYGMFAWFINSYASFIQDILSGFVKIGLTAVQGYSNLEILYNPSDVVSLSNLLAKQSMPSLGQLLTSSGILMLIISLGLILCGLFMGFMIFITWLECYSLMGLSIIFLPWAVLDKTAFITEKMFSLIISVGVKIMTMTIMLGVSTKLLYEFELPAEISIDTGLHFLSVFGALTFLVIKLPAYASTALAGHPNFSSELSRYSKQTAQLLHKGTEKTLTTVFSQVSNTLGGLNNMRKGYQGSSSGTGGSNNSSSRGYRLGQYLATSGSRSTGTAENPTAPGGAENSHEAKANLSRNKLNSFSPTQAPGNSKLINSVPEGKISSAEGNNSSIPTSTSATPPLNKGIASANSSSTGSPPKEDSSSVGSQNLDSSASIKTGAEINSGSVRKNKEE